MGMNFNIYLLVDFSLSFPISHSIIIIVPKFMFCVSASAISHKGDSAYMLHIYNFSFFEPINSKGESSQNTLLQTKARFGRRHISYRQ